MRGALAVASREVRERRGVLWVAALSGLLPLLLHVLLPAGRGGPDVGFFFAVAAVVALPIAVGLTLGASVIARDVAEGRLGFYFARPLSGRGIWAGKMGAALLLTLAATGLVTAIASPVFPTGLPPVGPAPSLVLLFLIVVPLVCVIAAHVGAVLLRSRSGLLPYDLAAGVAVLAVAAWLAWLLLAAGATRRTAEIVIPPLVLGTLAALVIAGAAQVVAGRGDARRGHRALSRTLWGSLAALLAFLGLFVAWVLGISPSSPGVRPIVESSPDGAYVVTYLHERAGHEPVFLVHAATGRFLRLGAQQTTTGVRFTADGKTAVWVESPPFGTRSLVKARLEGPEPVVTRTELSEPGRPLALSEDGSRVLLDDRSTLSVRETDTARVVARAPGSYIRGATFLGTRTVRVYRHVDGITGSDWDLQTGKMIERVRIASMPWVHDVRGGRMIVSQDRGSSESGVTLAIYDIETGRSQVSFPIGDMHVDFARWLDDGRVVVVSSPRFDDDARLRIFDASGQEIAATPLASPARSRSWWRWGGQAGDTLVLGYHDRKREGYETVFADARTAAVKRREAQIIPVFQPWWAERGDSAARSQRPILYFERGRVVTVDPATGARTRVPWQG